MDENFVFDYRPSEVVVKAPTTMEEAFALNVYLLQKMGAIPDGNKPVDLTVEGHPSLSVNNFNFSVPTVYRGLELTTAVQCLSALVQQNIEIVCRRNKRQQERQNTGFPPGFWYMVTLNCPPEITKDEILRIHPKMMSYFDYHKIGVALAALEHSSIWHIHYAVRCSSYNKNILFFCKKKL